jgi:hypothetical protein
MGSCHVSLFYAILRKNPAFIYIYDKKDLIGKMYSTIYLAPLKLLQSRAGTVP